MQRQVRLLAFDGGGVRGLSSLMILRRIMYTIEPQDDLYSLPKPCDHFDMICGTSTGGLLAIMLGRLGMGVQECIDAYCQLARDVFQERRSPLPVLRWVGPAFGKARFNCSKLEEVVKHLAKGKCGADSTPMRDIRDNACKVFVCATRTANTELALLRSYQDPEEESGSYTIWQAARATTAAPAFFNSIRFGNPPAEYVDGGLLNNNPIRLLMREATKVWGPEVQFSCVLSIGTGAPPTRRLGSLGHQVLIACEKIATQTERTARDFKSEQLHNLVKKKQYYRFNVARGLQNVQLEEWQVFDLIDAATKSYLEDVATDITDCAHAVLGTLTRHLSNVSVGTPSPLPSPYPISLRSRSDSFQKPLYVDLPGAATPYFTDRIDLLAGLWTFFGSAARREPQIAVLNGLGGMGKTQIALQYIERYRSKYIGVFFVDATSEQELQAGFTRIAHLVIDEEMRRSPGLEYDDVAQNLGFSGLVNSPSRRPLAENWERIVDAVKRWFGRLSRPFLLVFDGADDPAEIDMTKYIPYDTTGDIIITTRDSEARVFGQTFHVEEMPEDAAVELLYRASNKVLDLEHGMAEGIRIVQALGRLPLAINQAGGYLATSEPDITEFLPTYESHAKDLLSKMPYDGIQGYRKSAFTTWEMSYERLLGKSPVSAKLLELLSFVYPKDICAFLYNPSEDARGMTTTEGPRKRSIAMNINIEAGFSELNKDWVLQCDRYSFKKAFASLLKLCLINRTVENYAYTIHPVVHLWARERLNSGDQATYARDAVLLVARALPSLRKENYAEAWQIHRRLLPHAQACWENAQKYNVEGKIQDDPFFLYALSIIATSYRAQGRNKEAAEIFRRVLRGRETVLGPEHPDTLITLDCLASIYDQTGNLDKAEKYYQRVLEGSEDTLGPDHLDTLTAVNDLAGVYEYQGKLEEAEKFYQRALEGRGKQCGQEDPDVLTTIDALAGLYDHEGRIAKAEKLRLRAFAGREKVLGPDHPDTLTTALNLAGMYFAKGKLEQSEKLYQRACEGREKFFGPQHPQTLFALNGFAGLHGAFGRVGQAEKMYREVLAARELVLGIEHPDTLWTLNGLGGLLVNVGKPAEAEILLEQAAHGFSHALGPTHTDTLWVYHNLAIVYENRGRLEEAEKLHKLALSGHQASLGQAHPATLWIMNDLGACYARTGKLEEAETAFRKAYEGKYDLLGFLHPETLYTANCLAGTLWSLDRYEEAETLYKATLEGMKNTQGPTHMDTCCCLCDFGGLYASQRRFDEAEALFRECLEIRKKALGVDHPQTKQVKEKLEEMEGLRVGPVEDRNDGPRKAKTLPSTWGFGIRRKRDERQWAFIG
ncbi:hypothetical protein MMC30_008026 [Trapelia coarctata]|nr:hypothetical protein [Trapelia coarctata]